MTLEINQKLDLSECKPAIEIFDSVTASLSHQFIKLFNFADLDAAEKLFTEAAGATSTEFCFSPGTNPDRPVYSVTGSLGNLLKTETLLYEKFQEVTQGSVVCQNIIATKDIHVLVDDSLTSGTASVSQPVAVADFSIPLMSTAEGGDASEKESGSVAPETLQNTSVSSSTGNLREKPVSSMATLPEANAAASDILSNLTALNVDCKMRRQITRSKVSSENRKYETLRALLGFGKSQDVDPVKPVVRVSHVVSPASGKAGRSGIGSKNPVKQTKLAEDSLILCVSSSNNQQTRKDTSIVEASIQGDAPSPETNAHAAHENKTLEMSNTLSVGERSLRSSQNGEAEDTEARSSLKRALRGRGKRSPGEVTPTKKSKIQVPTSEECNTPSQRKSARLRQKDRVEETDSNTSKSSAKTRQGKKMGKGNSPLQERAVKTEWKQTESTSPLKTKPDIGQKQQAKHNPEVDPLTEVDSLDVDKHNKEASEDGQQTKLSVEEIESERTQDTVCTSDIMQVNNTMDTDIETKLDSEVDGQKIPAPASDMKEHIAGEDSADNTCDGVKNAKEANPVDTEPKFQYSSPFLTEVQMFSEESGKDAFHILEVGDQKFVENQGPTCPLCHQTFSSSQSMSAHIMYSHYKYKCQKCFGVFSDKDVLVKHLYNDNICQGPRLKRRRKPPVPAPKQNKRKDLRCGDCDKVFGHRSRLDRHQLDEHNAAVVCVVCGEAFSSLARLRVHIDLFHTRQDEHICDVCGKGFSVLANMLGHKRRHTLEKKHTCAICGKAFREKSTLQDHLDSHKPQEERQYRYVCSVCGKRFKGKRVFQDHCNTHTGDRPYECKLCGRKFTGLGNLKHHLKEKHNSDRPFKCDICSKAFKEKRVLRAHMVQHTGVSKYKCEYCSKPFGTAANLRIHLTRCKKSDTRAPEQGAALDSIVEREMEMPAAIAVAFENLPDGQQGESLVETIELSLDYETQVAGFPGQGSETTVESQEELLYMCGCCTQTFADMESAESHINTCQGQNVVIVEEAAA